MSVQRYIVLPNELALEEPYLRRDIAFTRKAFGLAAVEVRAYEPSATLDMPAIEGNRDTIDNIRLWDWQPLKQTFRQLQQIRSYYTFEDVDVDRYQVGGDQRQVLLSARELSPDLPGKGITWVNRRLQYTHGYGLVMAPAADKSPDGRPIFIIEDVPPVAPPSLGVTEAAIYYGEEDSGYRIVNTSVPEFDFPSGDANVYTSYGGHVDVVLDSWLKRLGRVDEPQPEACGGEMDEGEEALGRLVVARRHRPELLELVDQPFDPVPQPVQLAVERGGLLAHRVGRDHRQDAAHQQLLPDPVRVVAHVADQAARAGGEVLDQSREGAGLVRLAGREDQGERQAARVAAQVELGREPATGTAQRLVLLPPLAPAACWCARTVVLSSICTRSSAAPLPARAAKSASNTPRSRQRANRRQTLFHLP
jgi:hypothetical protein